MKRGLVLGGGGTVGIAWETGLTAGLKSGGVDLSRADMIIGTSAGSVCGTHIAAGVDGLAVLAASAQRPRPHADAAAAPSASFTTIFQRWTGLQEMTPEVARELGAMALAAQTVPESAWLATIEPVLGVSDWPQARLLLTAVNADNGEFVVWERDSGVPINVAVASSCAVPGLAPPITMKGGRYMDGGVHSGTNSLLAADCDQVVIIAPIGPKTPGLGPLAGRHMQKEIERLQAGGSSVTVILPDEEALDAFGPNLMDASRVPLALKAGFRQGVAAIGSLAKAWNAPA